MELQAFVAAGHMEGVSQTQELTNMQIRAKQGKPKVLPKNLQLILDAECCLDRLYGGFFSDWVCGGQWSRMMQFLHEFFFACKKGNISLVVAFNGALEPQRLQEWIQLQHKNRQKVNLVMRHIQNKGTPPPKVWWIPPSCLTTTLRLALRSISVPMMSSMDDHHQEVLAFCRENNLHGIMGDDADYLVFDPPRYFSARSVKLTFKGTIETKEFFVRKLIEGFGLDSTKICILCTLLGDYLFPEAQLTGLYNKLGIAHIQDTNELVKNVAEFVQKLKCTDSLENTAIEIFGNEMTDKAIKKKQLFVESVQYYLNGTKDGFLKYKPPKVKQVQNAKADGGDSTSEVGTSSKFASETAENEAGSLKAYNELSEQQKQSSRQFMMGEDDSNSSVSSGSGITPVNGVNGSSSSDAASPSELPSPSSLLPKPGTSSESGDIPKTKVLPKVPPEVLRTAGERHQKGLMSPFIYQVLTQAEVKFPVLMEDEHQREMPSIHSMYLSVRQNIYAILYNVHHQIYMANQDSSASGEEKKTVEMPTVKEWHYPYTKPEIVKGSPISWSVPTVQRLWFGTNMEDMRRRLRAFLTCMKSDSPLMVSSAYVPQQLLVMACVLRYLMQSKVPVLRPMELDAFLVTAFSPDPEYSQELQMVSPRGVQLASLFMHGVETAIIANEACGAPIPYLMCCPWLYFDGKLFHHILARTEYVKSLQELCNHRMEILVKVERMKHAILEDLHVQYARRGIAPLNSSILPFAPPRLLPPGMIPAGYNPSPESRLSHNMRRGGGPPHQRRPVSARGGQLEVAGVVVCSWGPNYSLARGGRGPPQMMNDSRGMMRNNYYPLQHGGPPTRGSHYAGRRRPNFQRPKKTKKPDKPRGRGITDSNTTTTPGNAEASSEDENSTGEDELVERFEDASLDDKNGGN